MLLRIHSSAAVSELGSCGCIHGECEMCIILNYLLLAANREEGCALVHPAPLKATFSAFKIVWAYKVVCFLISLLALMLALCCRVSTDSDECYLIYFISFMLEFLCRFSLTLFPSLRAHFTLRTISVFHIFCFLCFVVSHYSGASFCLSFRFYACSTSWSLICLHFY